MQRHAGLRGLSREHHHALVLVRQLRTAPGLLGGSEGAFSALIAQVRSAWSAHVGPHFSVEERELLPLCHGAGAVLEAHAATIRTDHAALRSLFADTTEASLPSAAAAFADRLESHVRFEERVWFPALEAVLDEATLAAFEWRLDPEPRVPIIGFHRDEQESPGSWIATLACGHGQHVRHKPPFQNAEWVTSTDGRTSKIGTRLPCVLCRMPRLPPAAVAYKETDVFDEHSVPAGLLASHNLRAGTWGQIVVLEGKLDYVIEGAAGMAFVLRPGVDGCVAPEQQHHVKLHPRARFKVVFLR